MMTRRWLPMVFVGVVLATLSGGCSRPAEIMSYTVPKPEVLWRANHVAGSQPPPPSPNPFVERPARQTPGVASRLLGAIVPVKSELWFFKLVGPQGDVDAVREGFERLIGSLRFGADGKPSWTLPEGWKARPGSSMRYATLVPREGLELSVIPLPATEKDLAADVLKNVNRWRDQLQLPPQTQDELRGSSVDVSLGSGERATLVMLAGTASGEGSMAAPFARGGAVAEQGAGNTPGAAAGSDELTYTVPAGWEPGTRSQIRKASFVVKEGGKTAEITAIWLPADANELLPNVNRWRGQVGLKETTAAELEREVKSVPVGTATGRLVMLEGAEREGSRQSLVGVMAVVGERAWFFKLQGDAGLVAREMAAFEAFLKSVKFGG